MLQHSLFDISPASESRFCGAFTTYLDNYSAPFLFISSEESVLDYSTLFHEFGHFADAYMNYNGEASIDLSEVSSQALELLSLVMLEGVIDGEEYDALRLYLFENALSTLIFQGFYACFEEIAYSIPRDEITRESLDGAVGDAAEMMGLRRDSLNNINSVLIPHIKR